MVHILTMRNITKRFPGVVANDRVSFDVQHGEIHALVGENGSGKSTLMSVLYGLYQADQGDIIVHGRRVSISEPRQAIDLKIGMVFQHFMLVDTLTVAENVILGSETSRGLFVDKKEAERLVNQLAKDYGLHVDPREKVQHLSVGLQQRVEILKALYRGAELLILDEPTAVLTPQEVDDLIRVMRALKSQGTSIIFITHKIREVLAVSDRVTVLRRGKKIGTRVTAQTSHPELAEMMVGREVLLRVEKTVAKPGEVVFEADNVSVRDARGALRVKGASFTVRQGEILGVAGIEGEGQQELVEAIAGLRAMERGDLRLHGVSLKGKTPLETKKAGFGYVPEDRHRRGLVLDYSVADNLILGLHTEDRFVKRSFLRNERAIAENARDLVEAYDIRPPNPALPVSNLSGGNQQKVVVAREFSRNAQFLVCSQPTRGVDVGAIEFIHHQIIQQRDQGAAVLLISAELEEILSLSDRVAVIYGGEVVAVMPVEVATEHKLGFLMLGGRLEEYEKDGAADVGQTG